MTDMSFAVVTDTSANLPTKRLKELNIQVLPFTYHYNGESYNCLDTDAFDGDDFYDRIRGGLEVTTSQITPMHYIDLFRPMLEAGQDIMFISMSSGISGSYNSGCMAADELREDFPERKIVLIDTRAASLGEGIVALKAAEYRDAGMDIEEAAGLLRDMSARVCQIFTVDDLMHLRRGGRLSNLSAIVGTVLNIKPLLKGNDLGQIVAFAKLRGRKKSIEAIAERYDKLVFEPEKNIVGIAQAGCRADGDYLEALLRRNNPPMEILNVEYEPVTGAHVGPGALALFFVGPEGAREKIE